MKLGTKLTIYLSLLIIIVLSGMDISVRCLVVIFLLER